MNKEIATQKKIPTLAELLKDEDIKARNSNTNLVVLLNQNPPNNWILKHPFIKKEITNEQGQKIKVDYEYLPINKVEFLLKKIFIDYKIEVLKTGMLLNSVEVSVRVHYKHPITNEWLFHDGVGCQEIQTAQGSGSLKLDMTNINKSAVQMALPIAKTLAIKDACDHFGKLFGSDLNRNNNRDYSALQMPTSAEETHNSKEKERVTKHILQCTSEDELLQVYDLVGKYNLVTIYESKLSILNGNK
jgi:hypothetical protein